MNTIEINDIKLKSPSKWNELSRDQLLYIAARFRYWQWLARKKYTFTRQRVLLLMKLMDIHPLNIFSKRRKLFLALRSTNHQDQFCDLLKTTDFVLQQENNLTKNLLPIFRFGFTTYYGPSDRLRNISLKEFSFADTFYHQYRKTNDKKWLDMLVATLYRQAPAKGREVSGDARERFDNQKLDAHIAAMRHVPEKIKQAILLWYIGCRLAMVKKYPAVFSGKEKSKGKNSGWDEFTIQMAGAKFGDVEKTEQTSVHTMFLFIEVNSKEK